MIYISITKSQNWQKQKSKNNKKTNRKKEAKPPPKKQQQKQQQQKTSNKYKQTNQKGHILGDGYGRGDTVSDCCLTFQLHH